MFSNDDDRRRPWLAALMSAVLPGLGQLYVGRPQRAIWCFLALVGFGVAVVGVAAAWLPPRWMMAGLVVATLGSIGTWLFAIVDAWRSACAAVGFVPRPWQGAGTYVLIALLGSGVVLPLCTSWVRSQEVEPFHVPSASMSPSLLPGDYLFADKRYNRPGALGARAVARGDVVIFVFPNDRTRYYVKRVIGLPGERVRIADGALSVDGRALAQGAVGEREGLRVVTEADGERHWQVQPAPGDTTTLEMTVPAGQVFLLGDRREASEDSRSFGTVPLTDVVGRVRQVWFSTGPDGVRWSRLGTVVQ